jgi:hypothetical protein
MTDPFMTQTPPFFHLAVGDWEALETRLPTAEGVVVCVLDGSAATTPAALFQEAARALALPSNYQGSWDALDEGLTDLEWLSGRRIVLAVRDAGLMLSLAPEDLELLVEILVTTAEAWAEASLPTLPLSFHVILQDGQEALQPWIEVLQELEVDFD